MFNFTTDTVYMGIKKITEKNRKMKIYFKVLPEYNTITLTLKMSLTADNILLLAIALA